MKKIKNIYTYGSSFTQGGGFEWEGYNKGNLFNFYSKFAPEEEQTQFNYSWPGQLKKLSGGVSVINQGKSGYGVERAVRLGMEDVMIERKRGRLDKTLFLFEFPSLGRKEYYFNPIDDYIISNYTWRIEGYEHQDHVVVWDKNLNYYCDTHGYAKTYHEDKSDLEVYQKILDNESLIYEFNKLTLNYDERTKELTRIVLGFLSFLEQHNVNYLIVNNPFIHEQYLEFYEESPSKQKTVHYEKDKGVGAEMYHYIDTNKLTITDETNGEINDGHGGLVANRNIAKKIDERLREEYQYNLPLF